MKNKTRTHPTFSTKTVTRYPKNIRPKTTITEQIKNEPKMKNSKFSKTSINPVPDRHNPKNQNEPKTEKQPFLVRF